MSVTEDWADRGFVFAAIIETGHALSWAASELRSDRGFVLAAVRRNGSALEYAARSSGSKAKKNGGDVTRARNKFTKVSAVLAMRRKDRCCITLARYTDLIQMSSTSCVASACRHTEST